MSEEETPAQQYIKDSTIKEAIQINEDKGCYERSNTKNKYHLRHLECHSSRSSVPPGIDHTCEEHSIRALLDLVDNMLSICDDKS